MIENEEVILVRPYEVSSSTTSSPSLTSFISDEVENLSKYMKFMKMPSRTRIFRPPPYYQSLKSRGEQDPIFWKEVTIAFLDKKKNTDTSRNGYPIPMYQGGPPHEPYFIAIDNQDQIIIGPSKKIVVKIVDSGLYFIFSFHFYFSFLFFFFFIFLFLEQLGLGFISHAVTLVTN